MSWCELKHKNRMKPNYCVYFHIDTLTNKIFYVGKGSERRSKLKTPRSNNWKSIVNNSKGFIIDVVEKNLTHYEALELEKFWINKIGKRCNSNGNLINIFK